MSLNEQEIQDIARLARLKLNEREKKMYAEQLSAVFAYISMLNQVGTADVPETCQITGLENVIREDCVKDCDKDVRKKLIEQFPERFSELLKVKGVFSDE